MSNETVKELSADTFDAAVAGGIAVVDFWAPWCGPCRMMAPIFEAAAEELGGKAVFAKVNIDEAPELAARFGVRSIPTLVVLKKGEAVATKVGLTRQPELVELVRKLLD